MSVKNWKFYYRKTEYESFLEKVINTMLLWAAIGLLWMSFWSMTGEQYPEFVPGNLAWVILVLWMLLLWLFYEVIFPRLGQEKKAVKWLVPSVNAIVFLGYFIKTRTTLLTGILAAAHEYLMDYNAYYRTSYYVSGGKPENKAVAFTFIVFVVWFLLWNLAYVLKKKWLLVGFPVIAIVLQLTVGFSPVGKGLEMFFIAALLMISLGAADKVSGLVSTENIRKNQFVLQRMFAKGVLVFLVLIALLVSNLFYKDEMEQVVAKKQELLDFQDKIFSQKIEMDILSMVDIQFDKEVLDNSEPKYTGRQVLTITMDKMPNYSVYLKGYSGTTYEESVWNGDYSVFLKTYESKGADPERVAKALFQSGYDQIGVAGDPAVLNYSIKYNSTIGNVAYIPYFSDYASLDDSYSITGDFLLEKNMVDQTVSGTCLNRVGSNGNGQYSIYNLTHEKYTLGAYSWYDDMVEKVYMEVPEDLKEVFDKLRIRYWSGGNTTYETSAGEENLDIAANVKDYLASHMTYNLQLEQLPSGRDPIEYFLTESKEGYCMHFASAGTLMLRYLGVPARYVSGYVVPSSAFVDTDIGYIGIARDRNAHAWVEVYVRGLGWVPVEMTPGYASTVERLPTAPQEEETESESQTNQTESPSSQETESESESQSQAEEPDPSEGEVPVSETENINSTEEPIGGTKTGGFLGWLGVDETAGFGQILEALLKKVGTSITEVLSTLSVILGLLALFVLSYIGYKRWLMHYHAVLERMVKKKRTRLAVKRIHRRMYGYIRIHKRILKGIRDKEFEAFLIETFSFVSEEEWQRYMEIAKKMHYSKEEISESEMMHCYYCYQEVSKAFFQK